MMPGETILTGASPKCSTCEIAPSFAVCISAAGYYIGTYCLCGPYSRESDYFKHEADAEAALQAMSEEECEAVRELHLFDNQLDAVPASLTRLRNLELLNFNINKITVLPPFLMEMTQLQELHCHSNQITQVPRSISRLSNLMNLWLRNNNLSSVPATMSQLTKLHT